MSAYDLVEAVKTAKNIPSDYQLAQQIGMTRATVSGWKRGVSKPDGEAVLKLITLGDIEPNRALKLIQGGYARVSLMAVTAILSVALIASYPIILDTVYYVKL